MIKRVYAARVRVRISAFQCRANPMSAETEANKIRGLQFGNRQYLYFSGRLLSGYAMSYTAGTGIIKQSEFL